MCNNDLLLFMLLTGKCGNNCQPTYNNCDCLWQILLWLMLSGNCGQCGCNCGNDGGGNNYFNGCCGH